MRLILILLFLVVFFIISIPLFLIEFIIGRFSRHAQAASSQKIVVVAFHVVLFLAGVKRTVIGQDNVPKNEPVLYVSNHRSYFDIPISYVCLPTLTGFIAKKEIGRIPFLRTWMRFLQCLFLDRDNIRQGMKTILQAIEQIKMGYSILYHLRVPVIRVRKCFHLRKAVLRLPKRQAVQLFLWLLPILMRF